MSKNVDKILLVDDEQDILNLLEDVLHSEGFQNIIKATIIMIHGGGISYEQS